MRNSVYLPVIALLLLSWVFTSCEKHEPVVIEHTVYDPPVSITSADTMVMHQSECGLIPVPQDDADSLLMDLDGDGDADLWLKMSNRYEFVSSLDPCEYYHYQVQIRTYGQVNRFSGKGLFYQAALADSAEIVFEDLDWRRYISVFVKDPFEPFQQDFTGEAYVPFCLDYETDQRFGWLKVKKEGDYFYILESAVNQTVGRLIQCGQVE